MSRKDKKGRNLRVGEYYDETNNRYMYRKMVNGKRYTITSDDLVKLRKEETKLSVAIDSNSLIDKDYKKLTLDEYFRIWCDNSAKSGRKATTYTNYKSYYKANVQGTELGQKKICDIKKMHCQKLFLSMIERGCKKSTLNNMKACLSLIFSEAEDDGAITRNPCKNIRFNHVESGHREAISDEQVDIFMEFLRTDPTYCIYYPFFVVLFNLGLRIGEACGITWDCLEKENSRLTINKSLNRYRKEEFGFTNALGSTKSKKSTRTLEINDIVLNAFELQRKNQLSMNLISPTIPKVDDYGRIVAYCNNLVFFNPSGGVLNDPAVLNLIHRIVDKQNKMAENGVRLQYFTPHMVRHTYTTKAYEIGADPLEIAQRLGHTSESTSRTVYTHLRGTKKKEQDETINKIRIL